MTHLNFLIPDLLWPDTAQLEIYHDLPLPYLEKLLSKSTSKQDTAQDIEAWLCTLFNIRKQQDNWPIAPLMLHTDGSNFVNTRKDFWLRADPVHLRIEQNHLMLADSQVFKISQDEASLIAQDINSHLESDNLAILPLHPERWYINLTKPPIIKMYTLNHVTCQNINHFLPKGDDSKYWHKIFNEIQMLLHEHPINQAREARGELAINSIWFWGGGYQPESIQTSFSHVWSNNSLAKALATASKINYSTLPVHADDWLQAISSGNHLVILDTLQAQAKYRNAFDWRESLKSLEQFWFAPLYAALRQGKFAQINITLLNRNASQSFVTTQSDLWKFWLKSKPISAYAVKH